MINGDRGDSSTRLLNGFDRPSLMFGLLVVVTVLPSVDCSYKLLRTCPSVLIRVLHQPSAHTMQVTVLIRTYYVYLYPHCNCGRK